MMTCGVLSRGSGRDESYILLICGLRGTYRVIITFRAYASYFRTYFITYFDRMNLAYFLLLIGYLSYLFSLILTYPHFFRSNK